MEVRGRACRRCGSLLAKDHQDDEWCTPCLDLRRYYDPRRDPHFLLALLHVLMARPGEKVEPLKELGLEPEYGRVVKAGVRTLRRQGWDIHSAGERCTGYRFMGEVTITRTRGRAAAQ